MDYFFVTQNKSFDYEFEGGYLWAPKLGSDGRPKSHWKSLENINKGDIIFSFVDQQIKAILTFSQKTFPIIMLVNKI
jgi:hypothetical protein